MPANLFSSGVSLGIALMVLMQGMFLLAVFNGLAAILNFLVWWFANEPKAVNELEESK